jgi:hypothetical protein
VYKGIPRALLGHSITKQGMQFMSPVAAASHSTNIPYFSVSCCR